MKNNSFFIYILLCLFLIFPLVSAAQISANEIISGETYFIKIGNNRLGQYRVKEKYEASLTLISNKTKAVIEVPIYLISLIRELPKLNPRLGVSVISTFDIVSRENYNEWANGSFLLDKLEFRYPISGQVDIGSSFIYSNQDFAKYDPFYSKAIDHEIIGFEFGLGIYAPFSRRIALGFKPNFRFTHSDINRIGISDVGRRSYERNASFIGAALNVLLSYQLTSKVNLSVSSDYLWGRINLEQLGFNAFKDDFKLAELQPFGRLVIYYVLSKE